MHPLILIKLNLIKYILYIYLNIKMMIGNVFSAIAVEEHKTPSSLFGRETNALLAGWLALLSDRGWSLSLAARALLEAATQFLEFVSPSSLSALGFLAVTAPWRSAARTANSDPRRWARAGESESAWEQSQRASQSTERLS